MANLKGIDVSVWNGNINWDAVKGNIDFAILRVGYGGDYTNQDDKTFKQNADACTRLGIPFGVYIYSYANSDIKAKSEAKHILRLVKGYKLSYPIYYDLEDANTTGKCSNAAILGFSKTFANEIQAAGYTVGFYANKYWWTTKLTDSYYNGFSRWVAQYASECTYNGSYDIWQYSSKGTVNGIKGNVDMNICYKDIAKTEPTTTTTTPEAPKPAEVTLPFAVGDKVVITGSYANSSTASTAAYLAAKGKTAYVVKTYAGTNFPYQLGAKQGDSSGNNTIGFANASGISKNAASSNTPIAVGDKVKITGSYASSAYSQKAGYTKAKGKVVYVTKIHSGTNFPYQLGVKAGDTSGNNTTGFAKASSIAKV